MSDTNPSASEKDELNQAGSEVENAVEEAAVDAADAAQAEAPEEENLQALLEDARGKADAHWDQLLRLQAEMDNLRRRAERDVANAHKFALEGFAQELLPVKDSLELGLNTLSGDDESVASTREGMELTLKMLTGVLEKFGIKSVGEEGDKFDPEFHQAMTMQPSTDHEPNTIVTVYQKGYLLNERLLRPAMVVVASAP